MPSRAPKRSPLTLRWSALRRWFAKGRPANAGHDANAQSILITDCAELADEVERAIASQLTTLPRAEIAQASWREFGRPMPRPHFHGIWAASFREDLKIEGNTLVLMQNLRNFTVQFELLRKVGVPV